MKSRNNANNIYRMDGIGKVFKFTLTETFKNKAYLFSYILMIVMMSLMAPISMLSASASQKAAISSTGVNDDENVTSVYIKNVSGIDLSKKDLSLDDTSLKNVPFTFLSDDEAVPALSDTEIAVFFECVKGSEGNDAFKVSSVVSDNSEISALFLDTVTQKLNKSFENTRRSQFLSEDQIKLINSGTDTGKVMSENDYLAKQDEKMPVSKVITYSTVYSVIVMILVSLTVSYVISSVMEEKTSKLVENLLVSVRPLALVMGKVFAMMLYVVSMIVFGGIGASITSSISALFFFRSGQADSVIEAASGASQAMDFGALFGLDLWKILILILSLILTYFMFSILSGIMGSACTKTEEIGPTVMIINFLSMGGYLAAVLIPSLDIPVLDKILSIVPFFSSYVGPISFVCGRTPLYIYLIGLIVQIIFIAFLFRLCALVYRKLIVNDSKKLNIADILKLSREGA